MVHSILRVPNRSYILSAQSVCVDNMESSDKAWEMFVANSKTESVAKASLADKLDILASQLNEVVTNTRNVAKLAPELMGDQSAIDAANAMAPPGDMGMDAGGEGMGGLPDPAALAEEMAGQLGGDETMNPEDETMMDGGAPEAPEETPMPEAPMPEGAALDMPADEVAPEMPMPEAPLPKEPIPDMAEDMLAPPVPADNVLDMYTSDVAFEDLIMTLTDELHDAVDAEDYAKVNALNEKLKAMKSVWAGFGDAPVSEEAMSTAGAEDMIPPEVIDALAGEIAPELPPEALMKAVVQSRMEDFDKGDESESVQSKGNDPDEEDKESSIADKGPSIEDRESRLWKLGVLEDDDVSTPELKEKISEHDIRRLPRFEAALEASIPEAADEPIRREYVSPTYTRPPETTNTRINPEYKVIFDKILEPLREKLSLSDFNRAFDDLRQMYYNRGAVAKSQGGIDPLSLILISTLDDMDKGDTEGVLKSLNSVLGMYRVAKSEAFKSEDAPEGDIGGDVGGDMGGDTEPVAMSDGEDVLSSDSEDVEKGCDSVEKSEQFHMESITELIARRNGYNSPNSASGVGGNIMRPSANPFAVRKSAIGTGACDNPLRASVDADWERYKLYKHKDSF